MAEIRLSKLTKQFSIGLARLVDFLNEKGANVEMNPNAKVSDEYLPAIEAKFGEDLKLKKDSEKVTIKLKEIIELGSKKKQTVQEEEDVPEKEVVIKSNVLVEEKSVPQELPKQDLPKEEPKVEESAGLKIVDKIDLSKFDKKPAQVEMAAEPEPAPVPEPLSAQTPAEKEEVAAEPVAVPVQEEKAEVVEEIRQQEEVKAEPREIKVEVERLAGPKVVDKIDLSQFDKKKKKKRV